MPRDQFGGMSHHPSLLKWLLAGSDHNEIAILLFSQIDDLGRGGSMTQDRFDIAGGTANRIQKAGSYQQDREWSEG